MKEIKEQKITDEQFQDLLETIQGSNETLCVICDKCGLDEKDLTDYQLEEIDMNYIHCPSCGWWVESHEMVDEDHCEDCYEGEDE